MWDSHWSAFSRFISLCLEKGFSCFVTFQLDSEENILQLLPCAKATHHCLLDIVSCSNFCLILPTSGVNRIPRRKRWWHGIGWSRAFYLLLESTGKVSHPLFDKLAYIFQNSMDIHICI